MLSKVNSPMEQFLESIFAWPTLPATVLLLLITGYWLLVMVGAVDLDFVDLDLHTDVDIDVDVAHGSILDIGFVPLRLLNLGYVPLMLWFTVFGVAFWVTTRLIDGGAVYHDVPSIAQAVFRNVGLAVLATKILTQPLRGKFNPVEPNRARDLIGKSCIITTSEVTDRYGEAQITTNSAPITLSVRSLGDVLGRGDEAEIVDFASDENLYYVKKVRRET